MSNQNQNKEKYRKIWALLSWIFMYFVKMNKSNYFILLLLDYFLMLFEDFIFFKNIY